MKKNNWSHYFLEIIVVFAGITAAYFLNNWREYNQEKHLEEKYLNSFLKDLKYDSKELATTINLNGQKLDRVTRFMGILKKGNLPIDSAVVILSDILTIIQFSPKTTTYESMVNSSNLRIVSDYELKEKLVLYYKSFEELKLKDKMYNDYVNSYVLPFVYKNMDILNQKIMNPNSVKSHTFKNLVVGYYVILAQNVESYQIADALNTEVRSSLSNFDVH